MPVWENDSQASPFNRRPGQKRAKHSGSQPSNASVNVGVRMGVRGAALVDEEDGDDQAAPNEEVVFDGAEMPPDYDPGLPLVSG